MPYIVTLKTNKHAGTCEWGTVSHSLSVRVACFYPEVSTFARFATMSTAPPRTIAGTWHKTKFRLQTAPYKHCQWGSPGCPWCWQEASWQHCCCCLWNLLCCHVTCISWYVKSAHVEEWGEMVCKRFSPTEEELTCSSGTLIVTFFWIYSSPNAWCMYVGMVVAKILFRYST